MAHDYEICKLPTQTKLFDSSDKLYQIICNGSALVDLCYVLRSVISDCKKRPLTNLEQDILSDLYNSISIYKLKHPKL